MKTGRPKAVNAKMKSVTIRLPDDTHKKMLDYAAEHKITKTDVVLRSLEEFLAKQK